MKRVEGGEEEEEKDGRLVKRKGSTESNQLSVDILMVFDCHYFLHRLRHSRSSFIPIKFRCVLVIT